MKDQTKRLSKFMSLVLRHKPETIGLKLDAQGWAKVDDLLEKMNQHGKRINRRLLEQVVATNDKKRFTFDADGTRIRANQGHSIQIELGYVPETPPEILYHGTARRFIDSIFKSGLEKRQRHHVHLSADIPTALNVGGRHGKPVILEVLAGAMSEQGHAFYRSKNGVWLTDHVPTEFLRTRED